MRNAAAPITTIIAACAWALIAVGGIPPSTTADRAVMQRQKQPEAYQERLVEWILEDPDGFFHPSIVWKRLGPDGKSGPYAMHAAEDIPSGTPLIVLPRKYVLESGVESEHDDYHSEDPRWCVTISKMMEGQFGEKYKKDNNTGTDGSSSFYAPYLSYLFEDSAGGTTRGLLPTSWSDHSKRILSLVLGGYINEYNELTHDLSPHDYEYSSVFDLCTPEVIDYYKEYLGVADYDEDEEEEDDEEEDEDYDDEEEEDDEEEDEDDDYYHSEVRNLEESTESDDTKTLRQRMEDAYLFLLSRGWYDKLLPVVDMFNHRNGRWRNVEVTTIDDGDRKDVAAYAWKDISKGDQLQYTYSECMDDTCSYGGIKYGFSTQSIFSEYGFTELYPQRWVVRCEDDEELEQTLYTEVTVDPDDESKLVFRWIFDTPNEASIEFIKNHLARLKSIESVVRNGVDELESVLLGEDRTGTTIHNIEHERESILEFYDAYVTMFELALEHKDDPVAVTNESFEEDLSRQQALGGKKTIEEIRKHELLAAAPAPRTARRTAATMSHSEEF